MSRARECPSTDYYIFSRKAVLYREKKLKKNKPDENNACRQPSAFTIKVQVDIRIMFVLLLATTQYNKISVIMLGIVKANHETLQSVVIASLPKLVFAIT